MTWNSAGDSPMEIPTTCPKCYPVLCEDPEYVYVLVWCSAHAPDLGGSADADAKIRVGTDHISGTGESGGDDNRAVCDAIHGRSRISRGG